MEFPSSRILNLPLSGESAPFLSPAVAEIARQAANSDTMVRRSRSFAGRTAWRMDSPFRMWLFQFQMRVELRRGNTGNPAAKNFGYNNRCVSGAVHAKIRELIGRNALRVKRAKARFVAK